MLHRLRDDLELGLVHGDDTRFGSAVTGRIDATVRQAAQAIADARRRGGMRAVIDALPRLAATASAGLAELYRAPGVLRDDCLYPAPELVRPLALRCTGDDVRTTMALPPALVPELASWLGQWQQGSAPPRNGPARQLWDELQAAGALTTDAPLPRPSLPAVTFVGHATVAFSSADERLLVDPHLLPRSRTHPADYQPLGPELAPTAVLVTHSHPEHFDPGTLLRWGPDLPIVVPAVARESILSIDMATRLRALGFHDVREARPHQTLQLGPWQIRTLPLHGDQPAEAERWHPEARNEGTLYVVYGAGQRWALVAEAGRDADGDVRDLGPEARALGPLDGVFGGYRGGRIYPVQLVFAGPTRNLALLPPETWGQRQSLQASADDLLDLAERWGARVAIPYAAGGAPWYWQRGLGPDPSRAGPSELACDLEPESVLIAAARRSSCQREPVPSPVQVRVLRPGQGLDHATSPVVELPGHRWSSLPVVERSLLQPEETHAVSLKKVLLRRLAQQEAARLGIGVTPEEVRASVRSFQATFGLEEPGRTHAWLTAVGLPEDGFVELMAQFVLLRKVQHHYADELEQHVPAQRAVMTAWRSLS